jgi:hypothetical protein
MICVETIRVQVVLDQPIVNESGSQSVRDRELATVSRSRDAEKMPKTASYIAARHRCESLKKRAARDDRDIS